MYRYIWEDPLLLQGNKKIRFVLLVPLVIRYTTPIFSLHSPHSHHGSWRINNHRRTDIEGTIYKRIQIVAQVLVAQEEAKSLTGDKFDEAKFNELAGDEGSTISKQAFLDACAEGEEKHQAATTIQTKVQPFYFGDVETHMFFRSLLEEEVALLSVLVTPTLVQLIAARGL